MISEYAGTLPNTSPVYHFLRNEVLGGVFGFDRCTPTFDVFHLDRHDCVTRYADRVTHVNVVCKCFGNKWIAGERSGNSAERERLMKQEYGNIHRLRTMGFTRFPHRVVEPFALSAELNWLLAEEYVEGRDLDCFVRDAVNGKSPLYDCLLDIAWFLADMHGRGETDGPSDAAEGTAYLNGLLAQLQRWHIISGSEQRRLRQLGEAWEADGVLASGRRTLIHGDPVPPNFLFEGRHRLTCIDIERLGLGDRARDLGCIVAELKHLFYLYGNDASGGEAYIRHFYAAYHQLASPGAGDFGRLTARGQFYMGCYLLRICRNSWLELPYRRRLLEEAERCLRL